MCRPRRISKYSSWSAINAVDWPRVLPTLRQIAIQTALLLLLLSDALRRRFILPLDHTAMVFQNDSATSFTTTLSADSLSRHFSLTIPQTFTVTKISESIMQWTPELQISAVVVVSHCFGGATLHTYEYAAVATRCHATDGAAALFIIIIDSPHPMPSPPCCTTRRRPSSAFSSSWDCPV